MDIVLSAPEDSGSKIQKAFLLVPPQNLCDETHSLSAEQVKLYNDIRKCRTYRCGFNLESCDDCGHIKIHYNSCCNRNCPICNGLKKEYWVDERHGEVIDAQYYHAVFTCPHELNPLFLANQKLLYNLFHKTVGKAIVELCEDEKYLGATPGVVQVFHSWSQELKFHPHVHAVISGGGLTKDKELKVFKTGSFFIPESVLSALFKGKFLAALDSLYRSNALKLPETLEHLQDPIQWSNFKDTLYTTKWVAKVKNTFNGNGNALEYLGRYIFKVAISDSRILSVDADNVSFTARGDDGKQSRVIIIPTVEFVRRFLQHALPKGFQKVRYYGFLNNRFRKSNLARIFNLQGYQLYVAKLKSQNATTIILTKWGYDICSCPVCNSRALTTLYRSRKPYHMRN